jgi:hypothetical protein
MMLPASVPSVNEKVSHMCVVLPDGHVDYPNLSYPSVLFPSRRQDFKTFGKFGIEKGYHERTQDESCLIITALELPSQPTLQS